MDTAISFLVVGRDASIYERLRDSGLDPDISLFFCGRDENVLDFIQTHAIRSLLLDASADPEGTRALLRELKSFDPLLQIVVAGPGGSADEILSWMEAGALDYFPRRSIRGLSSASSAGSSKTGSSPGNEPVGAEARKKYVFQGLVSKNSAMLDVFALVERISRHFSSVLLTGETGTGKELLARALFQLSGRKPASSSSATAPRFPTPSSSRSSSAMSGERSPGPTGPRRASSRTLTTE